ncbi:unnamed protein product [Urochloa humidicola]
MTMEQLTIESMFQSMEGDLGPMVEWRSSSWRIWRGRAGATGTCTTCARGLIVLLPLLRPPPLHRGLLPRCDPIATGAAPPAGRPVIPTHYDLHCSAGVILGVEERCGRHYVRCGGDETKSGSRTWSASSETRWTAATARGCWCRR